MKHKIGAFRAYADEDRYQLEVNRHDGYGAANSTCVHAQQYVEKMIKEKIVEFGGDPPRTHNLLSLMSELEAMSGYEAPPDIIFCMSTLNGYYFNLRYPDKTIIKASPEMAEVAHEYAEAIVSWLESCVPDGHSNQKLKEKRDHRSMRERIANRMAGSKRSQ